MNQNKIRILNISILIFLIGLGSYLVYFFLKQVSISDFIETFQNMNKLLLLIPIIILIMQYFLRAYRKLILIDSNILLKNMCK
ncbi:hypothetical protein ES708_34089 [subsurface metagenome]